MGLLRWSSYRACWICPPKRNGPDLWGRDRFRGVSDGRLVLELCREELAVQTGDAPYQRGRGIVNIGRFAHVARSKETVPTIGAGTVFMEYRADV